MQANKYKPNVMQECLVCNKLFYSFHCRLKIRKTCSKECDGKLRSFRTNCWNKGLNKETDERVKKSIQILEEKVYSKTRNKTYEEIYGEEKAKEIKKKRGESQSITMKKLFAEGKLKIPKGKDSPRYGTHQTEEAKKKIGKARWLGGISFEPYTTDFNKSFKNMIRKRDNQVCMNCGVHREKLNRALDIHHINYDKKLSVQENCISLCRSCHMLTQINREYWTKLFQEKLSKLYSYQYSNNQDIILNLNKNLLEKCSPIA